MFRWPRYFWLFLLILGGGQILAASPAEKRAFSAAAEAFKLNSWAYAEANFARFVQKYPSSASVPEAILLQAEARFHLQQYDGAVALLAANWKQAGAWADQYLYWTAQAQLYGGNYSAAADTFARLIAEFPGSLWRPDACLGEAEAWARMQQWPRVIELLQGPDGVFQQAVKAGTGAALAVNGYLLLGEAQLGQKDFTGAGGTLEWLAQQELSPPIAWRRCHLQCRVQLAEERADEALQNATNLTVLAGAANEPRLQAESVLFQAEVLERLGRLDDAIAAYRENLGATVPVAQQRQALLKIAQLSLPQNKIADAVEMLSQYLRRYPEAGAADLALLTLGELQLKEYLQNPDTGRTNGALATAPAGTNVLQLAAGRFDELINTFSNSPLAGKALLNKGWCLWLQKQFVRSEEAFRLAAARLPFSKDQAVARFKWADAQFMLKDFSGAISNYHFLVEHHAILPEVAGQLAEQALYQAVRAALNADDLPAATNALERILDWYPRGFAGDHTLLLTGQGFARKDNPSRARELFAEFEERYPANPLLPEVWLATARTYEQEKDWNAAISNYDRWIGTFTNHAGRAAAFFCRAWDHYLAGRETNALALFTGFLAQFPTNALAPRAQLWIGDYYFRQGGVKYRDAEENYQLVFKNTNWPASDLTYEAQMMAGRAAVARLGYKDAIAYFTNLVSDPNCPLALRLQAAFACGDVFASRTDSDATNHQADLKEAIEWFKSISQTYPTNELAPPTWGRIGDCYLQLAASDPKLYETASNAYEQAISLPQASVGDRSQAEIGLGIVAEKQARQKTGAEQTALFEQALKNYNDVFCQNNLRDGEQTDLRWWKEAGLKAARLAAEDLKDLTQAKKIRDRIVEQMPQLRTTLDRMIRAQELPPDGSKQAAVP